MQYEEVEPFLGSRCHLRLRCRACKSGHVLAGRIHRGKNVGEVVLKGYTFDVEDIDGIWTRTPPGNPGRRLPPPRPRLSVRSLLAGLPSDSN